MRFYNLLAIIALTSISMAANPVSNAPSVPLVQFFETFRPQRAVSTVLLDGGTILVKLEEKEGVLVLQLPPRTDNAASVQQICITMLGEAPVTIEVARDGDIAKVLHQGMTSILKRFESKDPSSARVVKNVILLLNDKSRAALDLQW
jgi:hypothetical protein